MTEPRRLQVDSGGVGLNVYSLGDPGAPTVVMLHGMRDVALSLIDTARTIASGYHVLLADLRGHGDSDKPGSYSMSAYLFDLHNLLNELTDSPVALFGHSLGGQIAVRFAAMFPDRVRALILVEGLGPPDRGANFPEAAQDSAQESAQDSAMLQAEGQRIIDTLALPAVTRPLPDVAFAASRLMANNPRLSTEHASTLAQQATQEDADGNLVWAFDPRVAAVFVDLPHGDSERFWRAAACPTLLISGDHADEYWSQAIPAGADWSGQFAPGEFEARVAQFQDAEHLAFDGSGHMVHFDEPQRLAAASHDFLRRRYE